MRSRQASTRRGGSKMAGSTKKDVTLTALRTAAKGLLFQSESDKPLKPFVWSEIDASDAKVDAAVLQKSGKVPEGDLVQTVPLDEFFAPMTTEQEWFGNEERDRAKRFQSLVATLKEKLTDIQVFRVAPEGGTTIDVFVVGRAESGSLAGLQTQLIET